MSLTKHVFLLLLFPALLPPPLLSQIDFTSSRIHVVKGEPSTKLEVTLNTTYQFRKITRVFASDTSNLVAMAFHSKILNAFREKNNLRGVVNLTNDVIDKKEIDSIGVYLDYVVDGGIINKEIYFARANISDDRLLGVVSLDKKAFDNGTILLLPIDQSKVTSLEKVLANLNAEQFFKLFGRWSKKGEALRNLTKGCIYEHAFNLYDGACLLDIISQLDQSELIKLIN